MSVPKIQHLPQVTIIFEMPGFKYDVGGQFINLDFKGMVNGGYSIKATLVDPHFNFLNLLIDSGYFQNSRTEPIVVRFQLRWGAKKDTSFPETATREQIAYLTSLKANGAGSDKAELTFEAIDPPSWFLNNGDSNGGVYKGKVSEVLKQVINTYAPEIILSIGNTIDTPHGKWWMMRQDPKSFISSLFDWSSSITKSKTQWIFAPDGINLSIKEQGELISRQRAFYTHFDSKEIDTIKDWEFLSNNALSAVQTKLVTQGLSSISGRYFDRKTDKDEKIVFAKDMNTPNKQTARVKIDKGFTKPDDSAGKSKTAGWSSITAIPEIGSAGDLGLQYDEYIDGRPRTMWLNMVNTLMRVKFSCSGHGEWSSCQGLGVDTIFVKWRSANSNDNNNKPYWWMTGNWLAYGFHHRITKKYWWTDVYAARYDYNAASKQVGGFTDGSGTFLGTNQTTTSTGGSSGGGGASGSF